MIGCSSAEETAFRQHTRTGNMALGLSVHYILVMWCQPRAAGRRKAPGRGGGARLGAAATKRLRGRACQGHGTGSGGPGNLSPVTDGAVEPVSTRRTSC